MKKFVKNVKIRYQQFIQTMEPCVVEEIQTQANGLFKICLIINIPFLMIGFMIYGLFIEWPDSSFAIYCILNYALWCIKEISITVLFICIIFCIFNIGCMILSRKIQKKI